MRYLSTFNLFEANTYQDVTNLGYDHSVLAFTPSEINQISELTGFKLIKRHSFKYAGQSLDCQKILFLSIVPNQVSWIAKSEDDYFYLYTLYYLKLKVYKCDQIDGLAECIAKNVRGGSKKSKIFEANNTFYWENEVPKYGSQEAFYFTHHEIERLENLVSKSNRFLIKSETDLWFGFAMRFIDDKRLIVSKEPIVENRIPLVYSFIWISKFADEWYLVTVKTDEDGYTNYRCDQLEGLIQCLTDMLKKD